MTVSLKNYLTGQTEKHCKKYLTGTPQNYQGYENQKYLINCHQEIKETRWLVMMNGILENKNISRKTNEI
jgi:hypothetical protein